MRAALVRDFRIEVTTTDRPQLQPGEALVRVAASSINQGEVRATQAKPHWALSHGEAERGWCPGWDFAGTIEVAAAGDKGPPVGTRVFGWVRQGAWAEYAAAPIDQMEEIPDGVSFEDAATIPIAGLTAWHSLRLGGLGIGKKVLVTGAAGGVGQVALQIVRAAGATATAMVGSDARAQTIRHLADHVSVGMPQSGTFDIILECIGGKTLSDAIGLIAPYGVIVSYGNSAREDTIFDPGPAFRAPCLSLQSFSLHTELERRPSRAEGLKEMVDMVASGTLTPMISLRAPLEEVVTACDALLARKVDGKAVLCITPK